MRALAEEATLERLVCVSLEPRRRQVDGVTVLSVRQFLDGLWSGEFSR